MGRKSRLSLDYHVKVAQAILTGLACPRALTVSILLRHGEWDEIANLRISPSDYLTWDSFFRAYQATKLLSKARWLRTSFDTREVAVGKFKEAEEQCRRTNEIWALRRDGKLKFLRHIELALFRAQRKIGEVLGNHLYAWTELCDFGPGADGSTASGMTSAYNKLLTPGSVTAGAYPYLSVFTELTALGHCFVGNVATKRLDIEIAKGNRVTFVSKNAKTDRPIAVEPRWNIWMQKGLGAYLRRRLRLFGVNLDDQSINQRRAVEGSRTGKYATIDLASASDTVSREVVAALLPLPWLNVFDALRSPCYTFEGRTHEYHKWSSMGNGYTFELESLLFWALCSAVDSDVTVYGDDLVVPTSSFESIAEILEICGFTLNREKSFSDGPFRESCGADAFLGTISTPIYWKEPLDGLSILTLVNQITVLARRIGNPESRDSAFRSIWKELVYRLPRQFQTRGPTSISTVVHDSSASWSYVRRCGFDGVWLNVSVPVPRRFRYWDYNAAVLSQFFQPSSDGFQVRDRFVWKKKTIFVPCGYEDIGPWV